MFFNAANLKDYPMTPPGEAMLVDFSVSDWLKAALRSALDRDPVDAVNDAEILVKTLSERLDAVQRLANGGIESQIDEH
jgi:hypothetical protein